MSKVDIWMPIYIGDYLSDTTELTSAEHGAYLLLLMHYWSKKGEIGSDIDRLARVCRSTMETCSFILGYYFTLENGNYKNKRADEEMEIAESRRLASSENGKKGGRPPKNNLEKSDGFPVGNLEESSSSSSSPSNIKEKEEPCVILRDWYKKHQAKTARLVSPSDPDRLAAKDLGNRYPPEELSAAVAEYWENWPDYWFAVKNGDMKKPREDRKPMYLFASFAKNIEELLQNKPALAESREAPRPVESIICPVCGTNETPDTRMRCRKCGFYLDPSWINDPELIAEYAESKQKEGEDA